MVKANARPEKESFVLVTFFHGENLSLQERYTAWDQSFLGHTSEPRMSLSIPYNQGTFDKRELRVTLPNDIFTTRAGSGIPHSPIFVTVEEVTQGLFTGDQNTQRVLYRGRVVRTIKNFQGRDGRVAFFALPLKSRLEVPMGIPCNHHCGWNVFQGGCGANKSANSVLAEIDSVDGQEATVTNAAVASLGSGDDRYWKRGYLQKGGLTITIRDYDGSVDASKFLLADPVPTDWIGGSGDILFVAGCDKTIQVCRDRYGAEETFLGLGYAIPPYQPNFESPA